MQERGNAGCDKGSMTEATCQRGRRRDVHVRRRSENEKKKEKKKTNELAKVT
jgi:hypothetical protein